jgi:GH24 family phage-related lysozyme (muramidase)
MKEDIIDKLAKKHKVSNELIARQLEMGIEVEKEHTTDSDKARKIALDHLDEVPDYYTLLKKYVEPKKPVNEDLRRWFKEKWVDISKKDASGNHPPCGRSESKEKGYPKCRPSRRVSSETPETSSEMSPKEKNNAVAQKRSAEEKPREGKKPNVVSHHSLKDSIELTELGLQLLFEGKNRPTNPALWSKAKAKAKAKFKVYPCVPLDSMAITRKGPAYRYQLNIGDEILTYNINTDKLEWKPILNIHDFEDAPLVEMKKSTGFKIRCTPNHKWVVKYDVVDNKNKFTKTELIETKELMIKKHHKKLVCCAFLEDSPLRSNLEEWSKTDLWTEKILAMSKDQREVYLASAIVYDGNDCGPSTKIKGRHTLGFSQKKEDHFWAAIFAAYLNGYHVHYREKKSKSNMRGATIIRNKKEHSTGNIIFTPVENDSVWCLQTENNTWVMIQNGFITITGNSAYANGFAAKWYKAQGGGWESVNESFAKALVPALALGGAIGYGAAQHQNSKNAEQAPTSEVATENPLVANTVKPKQQAEEPTYHHDVIKKMVIEDEGIRTKPYKDTRGILTVGIGHNLEAPGSKESFRKAFGAEGDKMHKHASSGGSLTDEHVKKLFDADYDEHLERTVKMIPNLHEHPPEVQAALVSGTYRGHVGDAPTFRKHFNAGKYKQAAAEFLNRKEYKDKGTARGVIKRLERDHQIFKNYSEKQ